MEILELKTGTVNVFDTGTYEALKKRLDFIKKRLECVKSPRFKKKFFFLGDYDSNNYENKDYIVLSDNRTNMDEKLKQELMDFLATKFIEQMNKVSTQMNDLIE